MAELNKLSNLTDPTITKRLEDLKLNDGDTYKLGYSKNDVKIVYDNVIENIEKVNKEVKELTDGSHQTGGGGNDNDDINFYIKTTYAELKKLKDGSKLKIGHYYEITDYETTINNNDDDIKIEENHPFNIVVTAKSQNSFFETASVKLREGDDYFSKHYCNLSAWEVKYDIKNDKYKYAWADTENGKGVIYYMKDEWGNECFYDFKNIKILVRKIDTQYCLDYEAKELNAIMGKYHYTFLDNNKSDGSVSGYLFTNNIIKPHFVRDVYYINNTLMYLNGENNIIYEGCVGNTLISCKNINLESGNTGNTFLYCNYLTLGVGGFINFFSNVINSEIKGYLEKSCLTYQENLSIGNSCQKIITKRSKSTNRVLGTIIGNRVVDCNIGEGSSDIEVGSNCISINISASCNNITIGRNCDNCRINENSQGIKINSNCDNIILGKNSDYNEFSENCSGISLGDNSSYNHFLTKSYGINMENTQVVGKFFMFDPTDQQTKEIDIKFK